MTKLHPHRTLRILKTVLLVGLLLGLSMAVYIAIDGLTDELRPVDVAVVPGNRVDPDGQPSPWLKTRLDRTVELYRQGLFANVIVSGGLGSEGFDEAAVMMDYLVSAGIPKSRILIDSGGADTYATAVNAAALMDAHGWKSAMVVSQYYHVPRTRLALQRCGLQTVYGAHAEGFTYRGLVILAREVIASPVYAFRSYPLHH
jgi:vancomycin permeability regulator SanA